MIAVAHWSKVEQKGLISLLLRDLKAGDICHVLDQWSEFDQEHSLRILIIEVLEEMFVANFGLCQDIPDTTEGKTRHIVSVAQFRAAVHLLVIELKEGKRIRAELVNMCDFSDQTNQMFFLKELFEELGSSKFFETLSRPDLRKVFDWISLFPAFLKRLGSGNVSSVDVGFIFDGYGDAFDQITTGMWSDPIVDRLAVLSLLSFRRQQVLRIPLKETPLRFEESELGNICTRFYREFTSENSAFSLLFSTLELEYQIGLLVHFAGAATFSSIRLLKDLIFNTDTKNSILPAMPENILSQLKGMLERNNEHLVSQFWRCECGYIYGSAYSLLFFFLRTNPQLQIAANR